MSGAFFFELISLLPVLRHACYLQDVPIPSFGPLIISNDPSVFRSCDYVMDLQTDACERLCVRLEMLTDNDTGQTQLHIWNRSR